MCTGFCCGGLQLPKGKTPSCSSTRRGNLLKKEARLVGHIASDVIILIHVSVCLEHV